MSGGVSLSNASPSPTPPSSGGSASRGVRSAAEVIERSGLPRPLAETTTAVVRRTRLWRSEKIEVTRELCGHFAEGLSRGATAEELAGSFGETRRAARMIRRAKMRNRPWWWKATRDARRCVYALVLLAVAWYGYHAGRFYLGSPVVRFSMVGKINEAALAVPLEERAWPIYRDAYRKKLPAWPSNSAGNPVSDQDPFGTGGEERAALLAYARAAQGQAAEFRRAAAMERSAFVIPGESLTEIDRRPTEIDRAPMGESATDGDPPAFSMLLPHLAVYNATGTTLAVDALLAADEDRSDDAVADVRALLGVARHAAEDRFEIGQVVGAGSLVRACGVSRGLVLRSGLLSDAQIVELMHLLSSYRVNGQSAERLDVSVSELSMDDLIQRVYTDNGSGNGHLTRAYLDLLNPGSMRPSSEGMWGAPALSGIVADRRTMTEAAHRMFGAVREQIDRPLYKRSQAELDELARRLRGGVLGKGGTSLIGTLISAELYQQRVIDETLMQRDATVAGLACELYHRRHGRYPTGWSELVPSLLPQAPVDRWNGEPMRFIADGGTVDAGRPVIYSVWTNRVDDGGVFDQAVVGRPRGQDRALWPATARPWYRTDDGAPSYLWSWSGALLGD